MLPGSVFNDGLNGPLADMVLVSKPLLCNSAICIPRAYFQNKMVSQFGKALSLAICLAFLLVTVSGIVSICAKKKVVRANAGWIVTRMKDVQAIGNNTDVNFPRSPISTDVGLVVSELAISVLGGGTSPYPAGVRLLDFGPELCFKGKASETSKPSVTTEGAATPPATLTNVCWIDRKGFAADLTGACNHKVHSSRLEWSCKGFIIQG
jgi:hypothetical protein